MILLASLAACSSASAPRLDNGGDVDPPPHATDAAIAEALDARAREADASFDVPIDAPTAPRRDAHSHTIAIDGSDDFSGSEIFATTTAAFSARVTWDATHVFVGYAGPDLDPAAANTRTKWVFAYVDLDPGGSTGATASHVYNTQRAVFPAGFGAELYARWKCDGTFTSIEQLQKDGRYATIATPEAAQAGTFVELAIPRALLGTAQSIGIVTWMINEKPGVEGSFAGLYAGNFTDGYSDALPLSKYLLVDFTSDRVPIDPANQAP
jgi:hypothetical protein